MKASLACVTGMMVCQCRCLKRNGEGDTSSWEAEKLNADNEGKERWIDEQSGQPSTVISPVASPWSVLPLQGPFSL